MDGYTIYKSSLGVSFCSSFLLCTLHWQVEQPRIATTSCGFESPRDSHQRFLYSGNQTRTSEQCFVNNFFVQSKLGPKLLLSSARKGARFSYALGHVFNNHVVSHMAFEYNERGAPIHDKAHALSVFLRVACMCVNGKCSNRRYLY